MAKKRRGRPKGSGKKTFDDFEKVNDDNIDFDEENLLDEARDELVVEQVIKELGITPYK